MTSSTHDESTERPSSGDALDAGGSTRRTLSALRVAAFWTAVFLPFLAGGVLLSGPESPAEWRLFGALVATSVVSMYVGHPHGAP